MPAHSAITHFIPASARLSARDIVASSITTTTTTTTAGSGWLSVRE